nr:hypothetical protein [Tanacetum cinerariifolium]
MTGNISYLSDFKEINGGYVAFGRNLKGGKITSKDTECIVLSSDFKLPDDNHVLLRIPRENNMYNFNLKNIVPSRDLTCLFAKETLDESNLWHRRLGHIKFKTMNKLVKGNLARGLPSKVFENNHTCVACKKGKQHRASCKAKPVSSINKPLQRMKGIKREFSVARTPQQNRVAERKNRTLIEAAKTMLADSLLPILFWDEAVNTACYVQNRVLVTKPHNKTPYELLLVITPSIGFMRPFGCLVTILNTLDLLRKFDGNADEGFLVGYSASSKAFRVFNSRTRIVQETLHINFLENQPNLAGSRPTWLFDIDTLTQFMNYQPVVAGNQPNFSIGIQENLDVETESEVHVSPSSGDKTQKHDDKAKREAKEKSLVEFTPVTAVEPNSTNNTNTFNAVGPFNNAVSPNFEIGGKSSFVDPSQYPDDPNMPALEDIIYLDDEEDVGADADFSNLETSITVSLILITRVHKDHPVTQIIRDLSSAPQTRSMARMVKEQALKDPSWIEAMQDELLQFKMQKVWVLVDLAKGKRAIGLKWVFRIKKDERGIFVKNKACIVAQGHTQEEGIDYEEVFAPVAMIEAIRLFLAYASFIGFMVYQMDVKSTFLYGTIKEEVYVCQPIGFEDPDYPDKVYKVVKALYGLHQAPRAWYETLANYLLENGFQRGKINQTLFIKKQKGDILLVQVYVDDIIFGSTNKDLYGKSASTPIDTEKALLKDPDGEDVDVHTYRLPFVLDCVLSWTAFCQALRFAYLKTISCVLLKTNSAKIKTALLFVSASSTDSQMHNNIMAAGFRDRPPMLALGRYTQWRSRFLRYVDTRPNGEALRKCILSGLYKPTTVLVHAVEATDNSPTVPEHTTVETPSNMSPENEAHFLAEKEAIHLILIGIGDDIYSTVDACQTAQEMWEAIKRLQQGESLNIQDVKTNLFWEFGKFTSHDGETMESYYTRFYKLMNEMIRNNLTVTTMQITSTITKTLNSTKISYDKGKQIAKPITPQSKTASEEDNNLEQAQRDKDMQKNLDLIAKYFKKIYKPTNSNLRTSSNTKNKNVDTTLRYKNDDHSGQFRTQRTECRKPKRVNDSAYHKEKMLLCKQAEQGVPLQAEQYDWLADTNEEVDEQELKAHYSYMAKIQEVPTADSCTNSEPVEQNDQNDVESDDKHVALSNLITNLKLDVDENKKIQKQLKKANTTLSQELKECKAILVKTSKSLGESISVRDSFLVVLQTKQAEYKKFKAFNDCTVDYDKLEHKLNDALGQLDHKDTVIREGLKTKAYELSVVNEKHDELMKQSLLTKSHYEGLVMQKTKQEMHDDLKYVESLEKEIDELESKKAEFSDMYDVILQECVSKDVMCSYFQYLSNLDALAELQCLYLHKVKECDCLAQRLSKQTESVSKKVHIELLQHFAKVEKHSISLEVAFQNCKEQNIAISELKKLIEKGKGKSVDTKFDRPSVVRQPNAQRIPKPLDLGKLETDTHEKDKNKVLN